MKVLAISSFNLGAILIKIFTFSKWNHTAVLFEDNMVMDVTFFSGVRMVPLDEFKKIYKDIVELDVEVPNEIAGRLFAEEQLGKKYDFSAILGIMFQNRHWENTDKWFCSELVERILIAAGKRRFRSEANSILPRETYAVL